MSQKFFNIDKLAKDAEKVFQFLKTHNDGIEKLPCQPDVKPGFLRSKLDQHPPKCGKPIDDILKGIEQDLIPGMTLWHHPNFFAYFPSESTHAAVIGEIMSSSFNNPNFAWQISPTATELENLIADWIVEMLGLPKCFSFKHSKGGGAIINSISEGYFSSVNAAKYKKTKDFAFDDKRRLNLVAYYPESSQFWCRKALFIKEIQHQRLLPIQIDEQRQNLNIDLKQFEQQIQKDIEDGLIPFWCNGSIGSTATGASDNILEMGKICRKYGMFFNVDAAYKGTQWVCEEFREETEGLEYIDSLLINFAKNMMMGMHGSTVFVQDRENWMESHGKCLQKNEIYKNHYDDYDIVDYKDWTVGFGKKFNSIKFYVVFNYFGLEGMQEYARLKVKMGEIFEQKIRETQLFEIPVKRELGLVCFRLKQFKDKTQSQMIELNRQLLLDINKQSPEKGFISGTIIGEIYTLRFICCNSTCKVESVNQFIEKLMDCSKQIIENN